MKTFIIYGHSEKGHVAIKNGFSWPAFFPSQSLGNDAWAILNILFYVLFCVIVASLLLFLQLKLKPNSWIGLFIVSILLGKASIFNERGNYWLIKKKIKEYE